MQQIVPQASLDPVKLDFCDEDFCVLCDDSHAWWDALVPAVEQGQPTDINRIARQADFAVNFRPSPGPDTLSRSIPLYLNMYLAVSHFGLFKGLRFEISISLNV